MHFSHDGATCVRSPRAGVARWVPGLWNPARPSIPSAGLMGEKARATGIRLWASVRRVTSGLGLGLALLKKWPGSPSARETPLGKPKTRARRRWAELRRLLCAPLQVLGCSPNLDLLAPAPAVHQNGYSYTTTATTAAAATTATHTHTPRVRLLCSQYSLVERHLSPTT